MGEQGTPKGGLKESARFGLTKEGRSMIGVLVFGLFSVTVLATVLLAIPRGRLAPAADDAVPGFLPRRELFSPAERTFLGVLEQITAERFRIFGKVRLGDLVRPGKRLSGSLRTGIGRRLRQKHVDFVLCHADTLAVAGVVELDDPSHRWRDRHALVEKALASAGIPALRLTACDGYAVSEVREKLAAALGLPGCELPESGPLAGRPRGSRQSGTGVSADGSGAGSVHVPTCSVCGSGMVKRQAQNEKYGGQWFWVCSGYPRCRKFVAVGD